VQLYDTHKKAFSVRKTKKPKFSNHRGRTWDSVYKHIDGEKVTFWFDSTWGHNFYFCHNEQWYVTSISGDYLKEGIEETENLYTKKTN
jgi:hypothetical protein